MIDHYANKTKDAEKNLLELIKYAKLNN